MSKQGSLLRLERYKLSKNEKMLKMEQDFYDKTYGSVPAEKKKVVKV